MNRTELTEGIARRAGLDPKQAAAALGALTAAVREGLAAGEKVALTGFGTFEIKTRAARQSRNPRTGEAVAVPEKKVPVFKAGKALREAIH